MAAVRGDVTISVRWLEKSGGYNAAVRNGNVQIQKMDRNCTKLIRKSNAPVILVKVWEQTAVPF